MKVSIIIPVYNEFTALPKVLDRVCQAELPAGCEREIIVVDDGSTDGTSDMLKRYRTESGIVVVHHSVLNFGKGTAVRVGLAMATGNLIIIQDGDLEYDPQDYRKLLDPLIRGEADVVYGSRFLGEIQGMRWSNWLANKILTLAANVLFRAGISDEATAYKAFLAGVIKSIPLECRRFEFCPEVTAKVRRLGYSIEEVPISYNARSILDGKKIKARDGFEALWTLLKYRFLPVRATTGAKIVRDPASAGMAARLFLLGMLPLLMWLYLRSDAAAPLPTGAIWERYTATASMAICELPERGWLLLRYVFQTYAISAAIMLADFLFGAMLLSLFAARRRWAPGLHAAASLAIGSGVAGSCIFLFGVFHLIYPAALVALTLLPAVCAVAYFSVTRRWHEPFRFAGALRWKRLSRPSRATLGVLLLLLAPAVLMEALDLMMPVLEFDSGMYHMSAAKLYRQTHSVAYDGGIRFNAQPHLPVLLYLRQATLLGDDDLTKPANVGFLTILAFVFHYAARRFRLRGGWMTSILFAGASPVFLWTAKIEYLDLGLIAFFAIALALLWDDIARPGALPAWPAGALLGFTAASKFQGMALAAIAVAVFVACELAAGMPRRAVRRRLCVFVLLTLATTAGWLIRSYVHTGAPLYPFFSTASSQESNAVTSHALGLGLGHSAGALLTSGYRIATLTPFRFGDPFGFGIGLVLLECLAILALAGNRYYWPRRAFWGICFLSGIVGSYLLFWFFTGQVLRYLISVLPVMAILLLAALRALSFRSVPVLVQGCLLVLTMHASTLTNSVSRYGLLPPVTYADRDRTLVAALPFYRAAKALNAEARETDRVYLLFAENARYYVKAPAYGDWFGEYGYRWLGQDVRSVPDVVSKWKNSGFQFILIHTATARTSGPAIFPDIRAEDAFAGTLPGSEKVYSDNEYAVYRIP